jgi:hypothetical protein
MSKFPLRHLSVRVPWHDSGWSGVVCKAPHLNGACVKLKGIAGSKNDEQERKIAGTSLNELATDELPPCVNERGCFMAPFELEPIKRHALAHMNPADYGRGCVKTQKNPDRKNIDRLERAVFDFSEAGNSQSTLENEWLARFDTASAESGRSTTHSH